MLSIMAPFFFLLSYLRVIGLRKWSTVKIVLAFLVNHIFLMEFSQSLGGDTYLHPDIQDMTLECQILPNGYDLFIIDWSSSVQSS